MNRRICAAARLFVLVGLVSFQQANAFTEEETWYFTGCVPTPSECKWSCPNPKFFYELGAETCNPKDYQVRYACYCWGVPPDPASMAR